MFCLCGDGDPRALHSFPTRRSSDLLRHELLDSRFSHRRHQRLVLWLAAALSTRTVSDGEDRKSTRLNSSHTVSSYAVFCSKKKIVSSGKCRERYSERPHCRYRRKCA